MSETAKPETAAPVEDAQMKDTATAPTTEATTAQTEEDDKAAVLKQVEFYLSDSNLPYDKFMWTIHAKNEDHWIPIATLAGFKRMREYNTKYGIPWIAEVLRGSEELLEVDEAGANVRRAIELKPPGMTQYDNSAYAKGFPDEAPGLQQRIEKFFEEYAPIAGVRFRRTDKKDGRKFKNSVFTEFKNKAGLDAFLDADPKPTFEGKELLIMSKDAYVTMKAKEKGFDVPDKSQILVGNIRRGFNAFKLMAEEAKGGKTNIKSTGKVEEDDDDEEAEKSGEITIDMDGRTYAVREDGTIDESELDYTKGKVLKFTGCGEGDVDFKAIKETLQPTLGKVFITKDYEGKEFSNGFAAFDKVLSLEEIETVKEKVPTIAGAEVTWAAPSDDDERRFWLNRVNFFAKRRLEQGKDPRSNGSGRSGGRGQQGGRGGARGMRGGRGGGGGRGGSRGNAQRGEKRKRDDNTDTPAAPSKPAPPVVASSSAAKKVKLADGSAADA
ncbi:hypothetical protein FRC04_001777 [Tulasnella sp. 424]|nr:hypothetical protein FRC04_001777 [Tulasnella sp. 424]KAG8968171.1 hypothetical protein FRC05_001648 [Tulasnella sp. 425]